MNLAQLIDPDRIAVLQRSAARQTGGVGAVETRTIVHTKATREELTAAGERLFGVGHSGRMTKMDHLLLAVSDADGPINGRNLATLVRLPYTDVAPLLSILSTQRGLLRATGVRGRRDYSLTDKGVAMVKTLKGTA